jgi:lysophospholipase L1-like esterase
MGDSITSGAWLQTGEDWPSLLQASVYEEVVNEAVGGSCIAFTNPDDGRKSWGHLAPIMAARVRPDLVIMAAGMNDLIRHSHAYEVTGAIYRTIEQITAKGQDILWATITPLAETSNWAEALDERRRAINDWLRVNFPDMLIDWEYTLAQGYQWLNPTWDLGGNAPSHPNAVGQQRMADFVLGLL